MTTYLFTFLDDAGNVVEKFEQRAANMRIALELSAARLRGSAAGHGDKVTSATIEPVAS